jgi:hypothetical protein
MNALKLMVVMVTLVWTTGCCCCVPSGGGSSDDWSSEAPAQGPRFDRPAPAARPVGAQPG